MKNLKTIVLGVVLLLAQVVVAGTRLTSSDKNWIGGRTAFNTTQGNDFWLTFLANNSFREDEPSLHFAIYAVSDSAIHIVVEANGNQIGTIDIPEGGGMGMLDNISQPAVYDRPERSEERRSRGVHVYSLEKDKTFSCFALAEAGSGAGSTRDASMILPTSSLGREYYIQTYPTDTKATEFAVIATEDNTTVVITPKAQTSKQAPADEQINVRLTKKGDVYMVRSDDPAQVPKIDMSGSKVCADKPVAVFQGNEAVKVANGNTGAYSANHAFEQLLPTANWGKEFFFGLTQKAIWNFYYITAAYDDTHVTFDNGTPITLNAGQSLSQPRSLLNDPSLPTMRKTDVWVKSDKPILCNTFLSCGGVNGETTMDSEGNFVSYSWGNSTMAMIPAWELRVDTMNFYVDTIPNESSAGVQHTYVQLVTRTADVATFSLDGNSISASSFTPVTSAPTMSIANIEVSEVGGHRIATSGEGFVGFVYTITSEARAYQYTLGYCPKPHRDSLYITNSETLMSIQSYDMDSLDNHGWYQRQWKEWIKGRIDTAVVCDSSTVSWSLETPEERPVATIDWNLYDVTDGAHAKVTDDFFPRIETPADGTKHTFSYQFILPEEPMENRKQFYEYELELILHRDQILCGGEELDTFRTVTRVTRIFNDTIWRAICMGDSINFFNDSLYTQSDLTKYQEGEKKETKFRATHETTPNNVPWEWKVDTGKYTFQRTYLSQFGCDSIVTFELFVCDTFRFVDTIHLCSNQDTLYHEHLYRGKDYKGNRRGFPITRVQKDTALYFIELKTDSCGCQKPDVKDKYKDKDGNPFRGCDSIYELHLVVHPSYNLLKRDTMRYDVQTDSVYHWEIERNGVNRDSLITKHSPGMEWNEAKQAWIGHYEDTLRTKTCSECNDGNPKGCDSINALTLTIPPVYYFYDTVTWCRIHYDWSKHNVTYKDFEWTGHHGNIVYTVGGDYIDAHTSRYGADSIYYLHLIYSQAAEPLYDPVSETVCLDTINRTRNWTSTDGVVNVDTIPQDKVGIFYFVDESRCDTIYEFKLRVLPTYYIEEEHIMSQEEVFLWDKNGKKYGGPKAEQAYDSLINTPLTTIYHYEHTHPVNGISCDSTHVLHLSMGNVYRDTVKAFACGNENLYVWTETRPEYYKNGSSFIRKTITNLPDMGTSRIYQDKYQTVAGFDSIFYIELYRAYSHDSTDTYRICQAPGATFDWPRHIGHTTIYDQNGNAVSAIPAERYGYYEYTDRLLTDSFKCDSIWHLHLYVDSVYHYTHIDTTCQFHDYVWPNQDIDSITDGPILTTHIGDYTYTALYHTIHGCDSIWTLQLHIDTVYTVPVSATDTVMCDKDSIVFIDRVIYGSKSPNKPAGETGIVIPDGERFTSVDLFGSIPSSLGCDSAVQYHLTVYKTYSDTAWLSLCQPSEGKDSLYQWTGHKKVWDVHNKRYISGDSIPRYVKGDTTYLYIDSLRTTICALCDQGHGGCDSLFFLYLTIDSTYHFYDTVHICENEYYEWQKIRFIGDSLPESERLATDSVLKPGTYSMRVRHDAFHTCDSIYYLELYVHPVYFTHLSYTFCDNDTSRAAHLFEFSDTHGYYQLENVQYMPHNPVPEADTAITHYDIVYKTLQHTLKSIDGCDSVVRIDITIKPSYEFQRRVSICHNSIYEWRGKEYMVEGHFEDKYLTTDGSCDSIFTLDLFIKPVHITVIYDTLCDNETYWFRDTIFYVDAMGRDRMTITEEAVWSPGDPRPKPYVETVIKSMPPDICDSLIYRYYLTICSTYNYELNETLCSGKPFEYTFEEGVTHTWQNTDFEYDTDVYVEPFDSLFTDSLQTVMGCDSIFKLYAHVLPAYRHIEYDTICGNETLTWRDSLLHDLDFGLHYVRDSLLTIDGCDSIYELRLYVQPKYYTETIDTVCADDPYVWREHLIEHASVGDTLVYDSLLSVYGCDSVFHLYLTVLDTTMEVRYDTICTGDTLLIPETGHIYLQTGLYKDTTTNAWGCRHFIYSYLEVIPPTVPTIWAEDPMCQSENAFDLYYTYTGRDPIGYSLYFDSVGLSMGFEDMEDIAITEYTNPMVITVPIPYRGEDPTQYPRPNIYNIHLVLDNGICQHPETDCTHDSTFLMSYPKWITEQRHGDVIAILNDRYNGGYVWSQYQWYHGDELMIGQTQPYLYVPTGLIVGDQYHVMLVRDGDTLSFPTCPITITANPIYNDYAPTMGYVAVTPTCVVKGHPFINILSRKAGTYRITSSRGAIIAEGAFNPDVTEVAVPAVDGLYVVQLWSPDTKEEPYRVIKIIVRDQCETCATSF